VACRDRAPVPRTAAHYPRAVISPAAGRQPRRIDTSRAAPVIDILFYRDTSHARTRVRPYSCMYVADARVRGLNSARSSAIAEEESGRGGTGDAGREGREPRVGSNEGGRVTRGRLDDRDGEPENPRPRRRAAASASAMAAPMGLPLLGRARDGEEGGTGEKGGGRRRRRGPRLDRAANGFVTRRRYAGREQSGACWPLAGAVAGGRRWAQIRAAAPNHSAGGRTREDGARERVHNPPSVNILYHRVTRNAKLPRNALRRRIHL